MTDVQSPARTPLEREEVEARLPGANLPTLIAVLHQLTGDNRWLRPPYRPSRSQGMDLNASGGLAAAARAEVLAAAADAIVAWSNGAAPAVTAVEGDDLVALLGVVMGEPVPAEYEDMMAVSLGFRPSPAVEPPPASTGFRVVVIGAGFSGLLAALRLRELGIDHVVLEKNTDVGGTWWENRYPGAGVDTPSHLYSYSFFPRPWSAHFAKRDEVEGYLRDFADAHDLWGSIRFGTEVAAADWDGARQRWVIRTTAGHSLEANVVISAVGLLNRPKRPTIPGLDHYEGELVHSARWPDGLSVDGRRVAIIGNGASAMQIAPAIRDQVGHLTIFQRSPQWIAPSSDYFRPIGDDAQWLMDHVPWYRVWFRARLAWIFNDKVHPSLQVDPAWDHPERSVNAANDAHRRYFTRYLEEQLGDRTDLIERSLPDYPPFGKRMLLDNGWFATLRQHNVSLVTSPISRITPSGVQTTDGASFDVDLLVLGTGFHTQRVLYPMEIRGRSGQTLSDRWDTDDARAHLGISVPDFPNLFLTLGPNTGLGHGGSVVTIIELQVDHILRLVATMAADGIGALECRPEVEEAYTQSVRDAHDAMVWTHPGMTNWYRNDRGRVTSTLPWRIVDYRDMLARPALGDYVVEPVFAGG